MKRHRNATQMKEWTRKCNVAEFKDGGRRPCTKKREQPLEAALEGKEMDSSLELPEAA